MGERINHPNINSYVVQRRPEPEPKPKKKAEVKVTLPEDAGVSAAVEEIAQAVAETAADKPAAPKTKPAKG